MFLRNNYPVLQQNAQLPHHDHIPSKTRQHAHKNATYLKTYAFLAQSQRFAVSY
ncbi:hypothetical protein PsWM33_03593 [Pseudovibrio sp. WM33]|nr:hypothetical protein PsWM33_03593 [Pseudovibrio sp. WM33]